MNFITDFMKQMSVERNPDPHGFQFLFNYGNFVDTHTGVEGVRRLYPGDYLVIRDGRVQVRTFYRLKTTAQNRVPVDEAISRLEKAFHQALSDAVYWNERHSHGCIVDLSAGADTRMMAFAMHRLKPEMLEFMTYAQTRSRDHRVAGQIAEYLHCPWTFMAMDDPSFLTEIDDLAIMNNGVSFYYGITGGKKLLKSAIRQMSARSLPESSVMCLKARCCQRAETRFRILFQSVIGFPTGFLWRRPTSVM